MDELIFRDFSELLTMKNQIIIGEKNWLIDTYKDADDETLEMVFKGISLMLKYDEPFFYLDKEYLEKAVNFIVEIKDNCNLKFRPIINEIIVAINMVKSRQQSYIDGEVQKYIRAQQELRDSYLDIDVLITSFSYDALVVRGLLYNEMNAIEEKDFVLASMNYLIQVCPGFFKNNKVSEAAKEELYEIKKNSVFTRVIRKYAKDTEKQLKRINKEG